MSRSSVSFQPMGGSAKSLPDLGRSNAPTELVIKQPIWLQKRQQQTRAKHEKALKAAALKHDKHGMALEHVKRAGHYVHSHNPNYEKALTAVNTAIELVPRAPGLHMDRGLLYRKLGRWSDAIAEYSQARTLEEKQAQEAEERAQAAMMARQHSRGSSSKRIGGTSQRPPTASSSMPRPLTASASVPATPAVPAEAPAAAPPKRPFSASMARGSGGGGGLARAPAPSSSLEQQQQQHEEEEPQEEKDSFDLDAGDEEGEDEGEDEEEDEDGEEVGAPAGAPSSSSSPYDVDALSGLGRLSGGGLLDMTDEAHSAMLRAIQTPPEERQVEQSAYLCACLKGVPVLARLPHDARLKLCTSARFVEVDEGDVVQKGDEELFNGEGSEGGSRPDSASMARGPPRGGGASSAGGEPPKNEGLHVLLYGEMRVSKPPAGVGLPPSAHDLKAGDHFGDLDLLHKGLKHVDIRSLEPCGVLHVSGDEFRKVLQRNHLEEAAERAIFIASVPMFHKLPWERLLRMVSLFEPKSFRHGDTIVQQGETPSGVFVIFDGRCTVQREIPITETVPSSRGVLHRRERMKRMHLETLMPRDTYGGDAVLHGASRSETSLVAETDTKLLFMPRADFSPAHLTEDAMRMLKLNAKLYRPDDELLLTRHYQEQEWEHAKKHYVKSVLKESIDKRTSKALLSRNPALMRRSSVRHPLFG